jgi:hypothetical protein
LQKFIFIFIVLGSAHLLACSAHYDNFVAIGNDRLV